MTTMFNKIYDKRIWYVSTKVCKRTKILLRSKKLNPLVFTTVKQSVFLGIVFSLFFRNKWHSILEEYKSWKKKSIDKKLLLTCSVQLSTFLETHKVVTQLVRQTRYSGLSWRFITFSSKHNIEIKKSIKLEPLTYFKQ